MRRVAGAAIAALFAYLALYTWNARTGYLDTLAEYSGLEVTGYLLLPSVWAKGEVSRHWKQYVDLVTVAEENRLLREEKNKTDSYLASVEEELAELRRLRALLGFSPPEQWKTVGTRVLAGRFGPGASLETIMIDRGFASGAAPGTPVATHQGLVGAVHRASPHIATVLLVTDPTFRVPIMTAQGRIAGLLKGSGPRMPLEVRYIAPNAKVEPGELLVTSGLGETFPKGIPVARITTVEPGAETIFQQVRAESVTAPESTEEALLLLRPENWPQSAARAATVPTELEYLGRPPVQPQGQVGPPAPAVELTPEAPAARPGRQGRQPRTAPQNQPGRPPAQGAAAPAAAQ